MTAAEAGGDGAIVSQPVAAPLTRAAIFLVLTINPGPDNRATVRSFCAEIPALFRAVEFRNLEAGLTCVMGIGSESWDRLFGDPRPAELHPFREIKAGSRHAVSTPGDLFFHIRAKHMDLCFELTTRIMDSLGDAVSAVDEVHGFRYFDDRDLLGFVDGTENPRGQAVIEAAIIGEEDPAFAGGSYVIVQKYLHDMDGWNALSTEAQERIIGREKLSDIELDDSIKPTSAHNALTTITENGTERQILRDNMPFGNTAVGEFGTYFIGYCRTPRVTEQMIENMFVGREKLSDIELDDSVKPTSAHNALTTITENGTERKILRDNMPFGNTAAGEFGTYFIGYCRTPRVTEQMIENMFVGRPPGNYDRILDFSRAVTGTLFFDPSASFLESVGDSDDDGATSVATPAVELAPSMATVPVSDGSLGIGSLKGENRHE